MPYPMHAWARSLPMRLMNQERRALESPAASQDLQSDEFVKCTHPMLYCGLWMGIRML